MINKWLQESSALRLIAGIVTASALVLGLTGCQTAPSRQSEASPMAYAGPPPNTWVYAYPERSQTATQQSQDRGACSSWAVQQTGFDPSEPDVPADDHVVVSGPPAETDATIGAIAGAIIGAVLASGSNNYDQGGVALDGALLGAWIGTASDDHRKEKYDDLMAMQEDDMAQQAAEYRRAVGACLGGRGYSVK